LPHASRGASLPPVFRSRISTYPCGVPPFTPASVLTEWEIEPVLVGFTVVLVGLYVAGVWRLRERGDHWPVGRTIAFVLGGGGLFLFATSSGLAAYDDTLLSVHMVQHMILSMGVPVFGALGAPVTLALRTLPRRGRRVLLAALHSPVAKVLTFAPLTFALYVLSPWALYFSGWYDATLHSAFLHDLMHLHLVVVGTLFFAPILGVDPVPGRLGYPFRMLVVMLTLPFHAFLGVTIMGQDELIGGRWYPALHASMPWLPDAHADQHLAGGILWASGDLVGLGFFAVLFVQWVRSSMREAEREDRRLDRLDRAARTTPEGTVADR